MTVAEAVVCRGLSTGETYALGTFALRSSDAGDDLPAGNGRETVTTGGVTSFRITSTQSRCIPAGFFQNRPNKATPAAKIVTIRALLATISQKVDIAFLAYFKGGSRFISRATGCR